MQNAVKLSIEGMHCGACIGRVTNTLKSMEGIEVEEVRIGSASVKFDPAKISAGEIATAVDRIGFSAHIAD